MPALIFKSTSVWSMYNIYPLMEMATTHNKVDTIVAKLHDTAKMQVS